MRYRQLFPIALGITALWLLRPILSGESIWRYSFIVWNVFLACVPLLIEPLFGYVRRYATPIRRAAQVLLSAGWLMFLPNSFYILTDFMHLNAHVLVNNRGDGNHMAHFYARGDAMYVYDTLLLLVATVFGMYVGALALLHAYNFFRKRFSAWVTGLGLAAVMLLVSVGVYIGRFARWNSWDGLIRPWQVAIDFIQSLGNQQIRQRFVIVAFTTILLQLISVWCVWRITDDTARRH